MAASFSNLVASGTSPGPSSKVEVGVACRNLRNKDITSKSDPICILYMCEFGNEKYVEVARTERIQDNLNPDFVKKFILEYRFEEQQKLKFLIMDMDSSSGDVRHHDFLGQFECTLGEIVSSGTTNQRLRDKSTTHKCGSIIVRCEEVIACNDVLKIKLRGTKLDKKDTFGKSDPFLVFYKANEDQSYSAVHKSEVIKNTLDPVWREMSIPVSALCNGDLNRTLKVECYDWDSDGSHDMIGVFLTNVAELSSSQARFELKHPKKANKKKYKNSGMISVDHVRMEKNYAFLDYIKAGVQINFTVAVDFTQSNGAPTDPKSLHYINSTGLNQYALALLSVGNIIQDYDSDKMFPALGFGGKLPDGTISHEFFLNMNPGNPFCAGIGGVISAYQSAIRTVQLWGPTNFAPVINHVARFASTMRDGSNYFVLLIITDGVITDMPQTVQAIIAASALPMSIIIVGVGQADFSAMNLLDGDNTVLRSKGCTAQRDIVQFVPMRDYLACGNSTMVQARLAKDVLAEIPHQFLSYMKAHNILPPKQRPGAAPSSVPGAPPPTNTGIPPTFSHNAPPTTFPGQPPSHFSGAPQTAAYPGANTMSYPGAPPPAYAGAPPSNNPSAPYSAPPGAFPTAPSAPPASPHAQGSGPPPYPV
ncbi:copine-8-like isoform X2 [Watersipora subatra]|uniref:copine-8-like isoform X2 n=1 Tax=Watersipora subatra TaxID=2589382 RepID=UPI00355B90CC